MITHTKRQTQTKKQLYSQLANSRKTQYKSMTNARIKQLKTSLNCENISTIKNPSTNSGVKNGRTQLFLNTSVPYYQQI